MQQLPRNSIRHRIDILLILCRFINLDLVDIRSTFCRFYVAVLLKVKPEDDELDKTLLMLCLTQQQTSKLITIRKKLRNFDSNATQCNALYTYCLIETLGVQKEKLLASPYEGVMQR